MMPSDLELLEKLEYEYKARIPIHSVGDYKNTAFAYNIKQLRTHLTAEPKCLTEEELAQLIYKHNPELLRPEAISLASRLMPYITTREMLKRREVLEAEHEVVAEAGDFLDQGTIRKLQATHSKAGSER